MSDNNNTEVSNRVEDKVLSTAKDNQDQVQIYLINGVKVETTIIDYDDRSILVINNKNNTGTLMLYKHAISSINVKEE